MDPSKKNKRRNSLTEIQAKKQAQDVASIAEKREEVEAHSTITEVCPSRDPV